MGEKKVLHVIPTLKAGGAEKLLNDILPLFKNKDCDVSLFVIDLSDAFFIDKIIDNQIIIYTGNSKKIRSMFNFFALFKNIKTNNYDVVHGHLFPTNYWLAVIAKVIKKPKYVFTEHNTHNRRRNYKILKPVEKYVYRQFNHVISISDKTQENLLNWLNISSDKFSVINNGIDLEEYFNAQVYTKKDIHSSLNESDILLLMVGSFTIQKNQDKIIRVLKRLPKKFKLILVGTGPRKEELHRLVSKLNLIERVIFLGLRDDVPSLNKSVDINIVSSHWEGFGLVAAEGMASGKPLIASNIDGIGQVVSNKEFLFNDINELYSLILRLIEDHEFYKKCSEFGKKRADLYSIKTMAQNYLNIYLLLNK